LGQARANIDYHIAFDGSLYSVPYNLVHELVEIRSTATTIEILHKGTSSGERSQIMLDRIAMFHVHGAHRAG
jgi:hypothetical protein